MRRESHVRFCERLAVKLRRATHLVCHCRTEREALALRQVLDRRFGECGLVLHPEKTKLVYCKDTNRKRDYGVIQFDFLGYTFRPRLAKPAEAPLIERETLSRRSQSPLTASLLQGRK